MSVPRGAILLLVVFLPVSLHLGESKPSPSLCLTWTQSGPSFLYFGPQNGDPSSLNYWLLDSTCSGYTFPLGALSSQSSSPEGYRIDLRKAEGTLKLEGCEKMQSDGKSIRPSALHFYSDAKDGKDPQLMLLAGDRREVGWVISTKPDSPQLSGKTFNWNAPPSTTMLSSNAHHRDALYFLVDGSKLGRYELHRNTFAEQRSKSDNGNAFTVKYRRQLKAVNGKYSLTVGFEDLDYYLDWPPPITDFEPGKAGLDCGFYNATDGLIVGFSNAEKTVYVYRKGERELVASIPLWQFVVCPEEEPTGNGTSNRPVGFLFPAVFGSLRWVFAFFALLGLVAGLLLLGKPRKPKVKARTRKDGSSISASSISGWSKAGMSEVLGKQGKAVQRKASSKRASSKRASSRRASSACSSKSTFSAIEPSSMSSTSAVSKKKQSSIRKAK